MLQKRRFASVINLSDELDLHAVYKRLDLSLEELVLAPRYLRSDAQRVASGPRDADRLVGTLFRRDPSEKGKIALWLKSRLKQTNWHPVVYCPKPAQTRQRLALII